MNKILIIIIATFFTTSVYASHGNWTCTKKKSVLHDVNKELGGNGEIVRLNSFTTMGMFNVLNKAYEKNPVQITGLLELPKGQNKVPIIVWTHGSGGAGGYVNPYVKEAKNKLLENGIGVMFLDSFCNRGTKDTWRDQSKATMVSQAIDTMSAYKFLKSHPRSNGKLGTTGHSRGGTNSLLVAEAKFTSVFLNGSKKGFDAVLPEAAECRMAGLFLNPELTTNTKMLYVHGEIDNLTLAKPCADYVKKIKSNPGQIIIDIKQGWGHDWHSPYKPKKVPAMVMPTCPANYVDDKGLVTGELADLGLNKYKLFSSWEEYAEAAAIEPKKTFKKVFKILKGEKCIKRGAHVGGNHGDEYMPQFINFFKENLL